jgi:hypothetical protein
MQTVYDSKTGEPITLNKVDARERLVAGLANSTPKPIVEESLTTEIEQPIETKKRKYPVENSVVEAVKDDE